MCAWIKLCKMVAASTLLLPVQSCSYVEWIKRSESTSSNTFIPLASQNSYGTPLSTVCYCWILYNLTLPCQCDIWLLLFLNLHDNTPPLKPILLGKTTLFFLKTINHSFANASRKTDCISISDCSLRSDTCFSNSSIMAIRLSNRSIIACCSTRNGRGKINSLNFVAFIFD